MKKLGTVKIQKNKLVFGSLLIQKGLRLPIAVMRGGEGPTCFIAGGMHGDEINGPRLVQRVMHSLKPKQLKGTIIFIPVLNQSGYKHRTRYVWEDKKNLNRVFPGKGRSVSSKIAKVVFEKIVKVCAFGIDCHDSGTRDVLLPHPRVHVGKKKVCLDGCTVDMGKMLGTKIVLERTGMPGMLAIESFKRLGKPILTVEIGGGLVLWEDMLEEGEKGIKNILIQYKMLPGKVKLPKEQYIIKDVGRYAYTSKLDGLLHKRVKLRQNVHRGDVIATIHDPLSEKTQELKSKHCGFVFSIRMQDKIDKGEPVCSILQTKTCPMHRTKPKEGFDKL